MELLWNIVGAYFSILTLLSITVFISQIDFDELLKRKIS